MMKLKALLKKKWVWALIVVGGVVLVGFWMAGSRDGAQAQIITDTVKRGTLIQTVEATGELESVDEVDLSFETSGTVEAIFVQEGEDVRAGDVIAILAADELNADVRRAQEALRVAQGNLDAKLAGATDESVAVAMADVDVARAAFDAAQVTLENAREEQDAVRDVQAANVAQAQTDLAQARADETTDNVQATADLINVLRGNMIAVRSALSEADQTLGIDNTLANNDVEDVLAATDSGSLTDAENAYHAATESRDAAEDVIFAMDATATDAEITEAVLLAEDALADASLTLLYTRRVLDATVVDTADYSFEDLESDKTSLDTERSNIQSEQDALETERQARDNARVNGANAVDDAERRLDIAVATQASLNASAQAATNAAEAAVESRSADLVRAEASLAQVQAAPRGVDVAALRAAVSEAQAQLAGALARLDNTQLTAPIAGKLTRLEVKAGEPAVAATTVATVQSTNAEAFQIIVDVPEADIAKVAVQDTAEITFDAFGEDVIVVGFVHSVDTAEKVVEGVVYYEVTVYLGTPESPFESGTLDLKPGMSADVTIVTDKIADALYIPQRAVLERQDGTLYVRLPNGNGFDEVDVEVGLRGDEGRRQILAGLSEGQTVILTIRD